MCCMISGVLSVKKHRPKNINTEKRYHKPV